MCENFINKFVEKVVEKNEEVSKYKCFYHQFNILEGELNMFKEKCQGCCCELIGVNYSQKGLFVECEKCEGKFCNIENCLCERKHDCHTKMIKCDKCISECCIYCPDCYNKHKCTTWLG